MSELSSLEQLQADVVSRLLNDPLFSNVQVYDEHKGLTDDDLNNALATVKKRGGKKGAAIIVSDIPFDVKDEGGYGPAIKPYIFVRCIERPVVNRGPAGTGLSAEAMALRAVRLLHYFQIQDLGVTLVAQKGDPIDYTGGEREFTVRVGCDLQLVGLPTCAYPVITGTPDGVTITCATPGATIYYTLDGSTPGPENPAALLVGSSNAVLDSAGAPVEDSSGDPLNDSQLVDFPVDLGTHVRAVAFDPTHTLAPSNLAAKNIS